MNKIRKLIEEMLQLSPVLIEFKPTLSVPGYFGLHWGSDSDYSGCKPCIEIKSGISDGKKLTTLVHEISHALCTQKDCECQQDYTLREQHAYSYVLNWLLEHNLKKLLKQEMKQIKELSNDVEPKYRNATKEVMKSELWRRCLKYIKG